MLKKVLKGIAFLAACAALTGFAPQTVKAEPKLLIMDSDDSNPADGTVGLVPADEGRVFEYDGKEEVSRTRVAAFVNIYGGEYTFVPFEYVDYCNGVEIGRGTITPDGHRTKGSYDRYSDHLTLKFEFVDGNKPRLSTYLTSSERMKPIKVSPNRHEIRYVHNMDTKEPTNIVLSSHEPVWVNEGGFEVCDICSIYKCYHEWTTVREHCNETNKDYTVKKCSICGGYDWDTQVFDGESGTTCDHRNAWYKVRGQKHQLYCSDCGQYIPGEHDLVLVKRNPVGNDVKNMCYYEDCSVCEHLVYAYPHTVNGYKTEGTCSVCHKENVIDWHDPVSKDDDEKEEKKEDKPKDLSKEAFGGREASQLSVSEQKSSVSYALDSLRASGNALAANVVTSNNGGNGKASDIAAVVADNRDAANQQIFAQVACANLGFKNVTPLATYNMYSLHSTYATKNGAQVITWANTGLKAGDTAFVVWYNQKLGRIELLPAMVDAAGNVLVNVPALGDVSTMTVVKASK